MRPSVVIALGKKRPPFPDDENAEPRPDDEMAEGEAPPREEPREDPAAVIDSIRAQLDRLEGLV